MSVRGGFEANSFVCLPMYFSFSAEELARRKNQARSGGTCYDSGGGGGYDSGGGGASGAGVGSGAGNRGQGAAGGAGNRGQGAAGGAGYQGQGAGGKKGGTGTGKYGGGGNSRGGKDRNAAGRGGKAGSDESEYWANLFGGTTFLLGLFTILYHTFDLGTLWRNKLNAMWGGVLDSMCTNYIKEPCGGLRINDCRRVSFSLHITR